MTLELNAPRLVQQIEELAETLQRPPEQVLESAVEAYLDSLEREVILSETHTFWSNHEALVQSYSGEHVAIRRDRVQMHVVVTRKETFFGTATILGPPISAHRWPNP